MAHLTQVCLDVDDPKTKARGVRALLNASSELKCKNLLMLTESTEGKEKVSWFGARACCNFSQPKSFHRQSSPAESPVEGAREPGDSWR